MWSSLQPLLSQPVQGGNVCSIITPRCRWNVKVVKVPTESTSAYTPGRAGERHPRLWRCCVTPRNSDSTVPGWCKISECNGFKFDGRCTNDLGKWFVGRVEATWHWCYRQASNKGISAIKLYIRSGWFQFRYQRMNTKLEKLGWCWEQKLQVLLLMCLWLFSCMC